MDEREFYYYIEDNFTLDGKAARLVHNIIEYIKDQEFVDAEDAQTHLSSLLGGAFGLEEREIKLYRAPSCEECGEYVPEWNPDDGDYILCLDCASKNEEETV